MSSLKHPKWTKKKQVAQLCLTPHLVATSWLSLKFVCLFHVSMFLWILKIHVAFDVLYSCIYVYIFSKKKIQDFQIFPKKEKNFQQKKKKILWTRGIGPLSQLKKIFELGPLSFLVTFSKRPNLFSLSRLKKKKSPF